MAGSNDLVEGRNSTVALIDVVGEGNDAIGEGKKAFGLTAFRKKFKDTVKQEFS